MRVVIQRVSEASVTIEGVRRAVVGHGLVVLLAVMESDTSDDIDWLAGKIARLRIFNDDEGLMNRSIAETQGQVLLVSQFTLYASTKKGNRPSFSLAARPETAIPIYESFKRRLEQELAIPVLTGEFGADMKVALVNDGPVTIIIDTKNRE